MHLRYFGTGSAERDDDPLLAQINKRLTLNLLIQGAASHVYRTAHHLVAEELDAELPGIVKLYDRFSAGEHLNYWLGDLSLFYGLPSWFWFRTGSRRHPFHRHRLLAQYGGRLSRASKRYLLKHARPKGIIGRPVLHIVQMIRLHLEVYRTERGHERRLEELAKQAAAAVWGIDPGRFAAAITSDVAFGHLRTPRTSVGRMTRSCVVGYGGVRRVGQSFEVVGRAVCWPLLVHELVKGTAELICLHGLNNLDSATYERVTDEADQLEFEPPLLQAGPEAWRRLLAVLPPGEPLSRMLMLIARLDPAPLEELMIAVVSNPPVAQAQLAELARE